MKTSTMARCACLTLLVLAGCGGGGGGGAAPAPPTPPVRTVSELMPAVPQLGATLYADATALRPFNEGAVWQYHGQSRWAPSATAVHYDTTTTASGVSASGATETWSNSANTGPSDPLAVSVTSGTVSSTQPLDLAGKGVPIALTLVELRSPVRVGDQIPIVDQHIVDTGYDVDGDKKADAFDVAIYVRVIGAQEVAPGNLPPLQTVRVDTVLLARFTLSSNGLLTPPVETTISTWYAAGIGIVRQRASTVESGVESDITDEMLVSYDRGDAGFGAMPEVTAIIPATSPDYAGQAVPDPSSMYAATAVGSSVLVATALPGKTINDPGVLLSRLDLRGRAVAANAQPTLKVQGSFVGHATGMLYLRTYGDNGPLWAAELTRFDDQGRLIGSIGGALLDLTAGRSDVQFGQLPVAAAEGSTLWLLWQRLTPTPIGRASELVLRAYALDGTPLGPEIVVDTAEVTGLAIAAEGGLALLSWNRVVPGVGYDAMVATVRPADTALTPVRVAAAMPWDNGAMLALRLGTQQALFWKSPLGTVITTGVGGMLLDTNLQPVIASGSTVAQQVLSGITLDNGLAPVSGGNQLVQATPANLARVSGNCCIEGSQVLWFERGNTPLTTAQRHVVNAQGLEVRRVVVLGDRALLLGSNSDALVSRVVWLNAGS